MACSASEFSLPEAELGHSRLAGTLSIDDAISKYLVCEPGCYICINESLCATENWEVRAMSWKYSRRVLH